MEASRQPLPPSGPGAEAVRIRRGRRALSSPTTDEATSERLPASCPRVRARLAASTDRGSAWRPAPCCQATGHARRAHASGRWPQATGRSHAAHAGQWTRRRPGVQATRRAAVQDQPAQYGLALDLKSYFSQAASGMGVD